MASFILSLLIIALFVLLIILGLNYPPATVGDVELTGFEHFSLQIIRFLSIFFGMFAIIDGIFAFCSLADPDTYKPFSVIRGIFGIVLGILMCVFPVVL